MKKIILSLLLTISIGSWASVPGDNLTPQKAMAELKDGNTRYVANLVLHPNQAKERRIYTANNGQHPFATVITCSDSRVPVEILFDQGIGDIFVIRVAGNVVNINEAASIEYGVDHLQTPIFVVLGHTNCGACTAVAENAELKGNIPHLVNNIYTAKNTVITKYPNLSGSDLITELIKENVWTSIKDLIEISPISAQRVTENRLKIVGAIYDIKTGSIQWLGEHPEQAKILIQNSFQDWNPNNSYLEGDSVSYNGLNYTAKWWTNNEEPGNTKTWIRR